MVGLSVALDATMIESSVTVLDLFDDHSKAVNPGLTCLKGQDGSDAPDADGNEYESVA